MTPQVLQAHLNARPRLVSRNEHNWSRRVPSLLEALDSGDVALVNGRQGSPISHPGAGVVAALADAGYDVVSVPGGGALGAVSAGFQHEIGSGCLGFLPRRRSERVATLTDAAGLGQTPRDR